MSEEKKSASTKSANNAANRSDKDAAEPKPVIITQRPILKDPALSDKSFVDKIPDEANESKKMTGGSLDIKLKPLSQPEAEPKVTATKAPEKPVIPEEVTKPVTEETKSVPEAEAADTKKEETDKPDTENGDKPATGNLTSEEADAKEAEKQAKHDAVIQKLIDEKTYFLPINAVEKRRTKRFVILGIALSVLLALAWVDIALDAGLIHLSGIQPVTHFFSN